MWRAGYDAFVKQVDVSARYRVHVGHAYLSLTASRCTHKTLSHLFFTHSLASDNETFFLVLSFPWAGGEASLWDLMNSSTQGPILEQLQKVRVVADDLCWWSEEMHWTQTPVLIALYCVPATWEKRSWTQGQARGRGKKTEGWKTSRRAEKERRGGALQAQTGIIAVLKLFIYI